MDVLTVPIDSIRPHPRNYRKHPDEQLEHIRASLRQYGQYRPVVTSSDSYILCGEGVWTGCKAEGWETVEVNPMPFPHDDPRAEKLLVLDNEVSRLAEDDDKTLAALLASIQQTDEQGLSGTGYDDAGLDKLIGELAAEDFAAKQGPPVEDPGPSEPPAEPVSKLGDAWLCGLHRVVCGDCTEAGVVASLFGDKLARMVWTDPPYGVNYVETKRHIAGANLAHEDIANDNLTEADTEALVRDALVLMAAHGVPGAACYVACPPGTPLPHFIAAVAASGFGFRHSLAWVKQQFVLGRCDYHYRHEVILYGWKPDGPHFFVDDHTQSSVFEVDKPHRSEQHPTMKPVKLVAQMVANSSKPADIVADPFLGSGTTLIAAEQLGRVCYGIELEPRYVDVAVRRWQQATGQTAILESTGQPFPDVT